MEGGPVKTRPLRPLEAVRAFGTMLGGSIALAASAAASIAALARAFLSLRRPRPLAILGAAATALYAFVIRPWHLRWGAEPEDEKRAVPGDAFLPQGGTQILHAVTIDAPVEEVWPWLAQLGQDRGGFYSYEWLENLAGCQMKNADRIHPEWQHRELGETVHLHPAGGLRVSVFEPGRALGLEGLGHVRSGTRWRRPNPPDRPRRCPARRERRHVRDADGDSPLPDGTADASRDQGPRGSEPSVTAGDACRMADGAG
jgi:hypothetical protein